MDHQQALFAASTRQHMEAFLAAWLAIEDEHDRLRDAQRALRSEYAEWFSMRALTTAVKVVRARAKLADHPTEPTALDHQGAYETVVASYLARRAAEREALTAEAAHTASRPPRKGDPRMSEGLAPLRATTAVPGTRIQHLHAGWRATIVRQEWPAIWVRFDADLEHGRASPRKVWGRIFGVVLPGEETPPSTTAP